LAKINAIPREKLDISTNHGKTICDAFQKRNVFFSTKNEM